MQTLIQKIIDWANDRSLIKDRKGVMYEGVFIKESDPRYENAVKELSNGTSQN